MHLCLKFMVFVLYFASFEVVVYFLVGTILKTIGLKTITKKDLKKI